MAVRCMRPSRARKRPRTLPVIPKDAPQRLVDRLHPGACRPSGSSRTGRILDRGRQPDGDGRLVGVTGTYFAFHDDVLKRLIARQAEIAIRLRGTGSRSCARRSTASPAQLLDQEQFDRSSKTLVRKQSTLEQRAATLNSLPDLTTTGSIPKPTRGSDTGRGTPKPSPINDTVIFQAPPDREARLESRSAPALNLRTVQRHAAVSKAPSPACRNRSNGSKPSNPNRSQFLEESFEARARRMRSVLSDLGINPGKAQPAPTSARRRRRPPSFPRTWAPKKNPFERQLYRIHLSRTQVDPADSHTARRAGAQTCQRRGSTCLRALARAWIRFCARLRCIPASDMRGDTGDRCARPRWNRDDGGNQRRLRQNGRAGTQERVVDALRASVSHRCEGRPIVRSDRSSESSARPDARPDRICITKHVSMGTRSNRRNFARRHPAGPALSCWPRLNQSVITLRRFVT